MKSSWLIYMGKKRIHRENFEIACRNGVWGNPKDVYGEVRKGDRICFIHEAPIKAKNLLPTGTIRRIVHCRVTRAPYFSNEQVWPDGMYPYRFDFEVEREIENVAMPSESLPTSSLPVLQKAINANGKPKRAILDSEESESYQLTDLFLEVVRLYPAYRERKKVDSNSRVHSVIEHLLPAALQGVSRENRVQVYGSTGKGNVTPAPWIAAFDPSITTTATRGYYVVYLYSTDFRRLYLSLALGAQQFDGGSTKKSRARIAAATERLRGLVPDSTLGRFGKDTIELGSKGAKLHASYEQGSIVSCEYQLDALPSEDELREDFRAALQLCLRLKDEVGPDIDEALANESFGLNTPAEPTLSLESPRSAKEPTGKKKGSGNGGGNRSSDAYKVGRRGEKLVAEYERERVTRLGRGDLAQRVRWLADDGKTPGYDILSFEVDGHERWIEVKSTKSPTLDRVVLTRNEWKVAKGAGRHKYCLYCVTSVFTQPVIHILRDPVSLAQESNPIPDSWLFELPGGSWHE